MEKLSSIQGKSESTFTVGNRLESVTEILMLALANIPGTTVKRNVKWQLPNKPRKRQFDVIVTAFFNNVESIMVIECKNQSTPVKASKVDAFDRVCSYFPKINHKIFISNKGYQKGAFDSAEACGIKLYDLSEFSIEIVKELFGITNLKAYSPKTIIYRNMVRLVCSNEKPFHLTEEEFYSAKIVCGDKTFELYPYIRNIFNINTTYFRNIMVVLLTYNDYDTSKAQINEDIEIVMDSNFTYVDSNKMTFKLNKIIVKFRLLPILMSDSFETSKRYTDSTKKEDEAHILSTKTTPIGKLDLVKKVNENYFKSYLTSNKGDIIELSDLNVDEIAKSLGMDKDNSRQK